MSLPAAAHDVLTAPLEASVLGPTRARLLEGAHGRVLEVGAGAGRNLSSLDLCEGDPRLCRRLEQRVASQPWPFPVAVHAADSDGPFPAAGYDTVVATFSLCRASDAAATASALRSALAEGGRVVYLEHVNAGGVVGRLQALLSPRWIRLPGGCRLDQAPTAA
ncbi:MAG: class I SAM-dependent methyltransferase, partial [Acidimicrobiales bacterium]